jgi:tyrosinase
LAGGHAYVARVPLQVLTQPRVERATLKTRESVTQLPDTALGKFRAAMDAFRKRPDNRGYQFYAGWHGVPFGLCQHHNVLFLPWHRGYLYHFELALQDIDSEVTIPWWNWIDEEGLPDAYAQDQVDGAENVLQSAPIEPYGVPPQPDWPTNTTREPGAPQDPAPWPPPLRTAIIAGRPVDLYAWMMDATSYSEFNQRCWRLHDNVHVWVGGTMSDPNWAAYDPIFWAHHSMVDRLWRIWQHRRPGALPPDQILDAPLTFGREPSLSVRQVLDVTQLGYEYAAQTASAEGTG